MKTLSQSQLKVWLDQARRDDWHVTFVGSEIRQMLGEIDRLRTENEALRAMIVEGPNRDEVINRRLAFEQEMRPEVKP
jgi:hypothetical protein